MSKKVHVLYLTSWYPTRVLPTNGDFIERHAQAASAYCQLGLLHLAYDPQLIKHYEIQLDSSKGFIEQVHYVRLPRIAKPIKNMVFIGLYIKAFKAYCAAYGKPQIIHVNVMYPVVLTAFIFKLFFRVPYVISEHWTGYLKGKGFKLSPLKRQFVRFFSKKSNRIMPVSCHLKRSLEALGIEGRFTVVPNVVDTTLFYPDNKRSQSLVRLLHVSHLKEEHKNVSAIIRVFAKVCNTNPDIVLQIVSENSSPQLKLLAEKSGVINQVEFLGYKNRHQMAAVMRQASYLILFSNYENLPCVIVEALASGLPVLSSNVGGIAEHITPNNGLLVEAGNEQQLFDAMVKMNATCRSYNPHELHDYADNNFSYAKIGKQLADIYAQEALI